MKKSITALSLLGICALALSPAGAQTIQRPIPGSSLNSNVSRNVMALNFASPADVTAAVVASSSHVTKLGSFVSEQLRFNYACATTPEAVQGYLDASTPYLGYGYLVSSFCPLGSSAYVDPNSVVTIFN